MAAPVMIEHFLDLAFPPGEVWPILSKTDWINRALGLPPVSYDIQPLPEGGSSVTAKARLFGMELRWQELPFEWLENEFYRVRRVFEAGPLAEADLGVEFRPQGERGTRLRVCSALTPRHAVGAWLMRNILGPKSARDMRTIVAHVEDHLRGQKPVALPKLPRTPVAAPALADGLEKLRGVQPLEELVRRLEQMLREAPDVDLAHIRPFAVARTWGHDRWGVLRLFLQATRCGLLNFSWEVLCPNCRSTREPRTTLLGQVRRTAHCEVCQIKFDAEFDKSVELKFSVNPAIRPVEQQTFCLAGPGGKPHIVSQMLLAPGQRRAWKLPELTQPYRLRSPQVKESVILQADAAMPPIFQPVILCRPEQFQVRFEYGKGVDPNAQVLNVNQFPVLLALERTGWSDDILTAARVTNWQEFRDLFSSEVVSPDEQITIGSQIVLFTDLRGSTAMYCGIGDAPAYAVVRDHFQVLAAAVAQHHGTIVKTIGDAVMAVFSQVDEALTAVRQMHQSLRAADRKTAMARPLTLKSSLHVGPCLAVNANEKLDYFGTTINLAARMVDCCQGDDLTVSDALYRRPEMADFLETAAQPGEPSEVNFRGFDAPHKVWRIPMLTSRRPDGLSTAG
ncbi:MAG: DUF5939 domain-containing protein [Limisphaerales bacterium]